MTRACERDQRVGQIFQQATFGYSYGHCLFRIGSALAMAVEAGRAGAGHLRGGAGADGYLQRKPVAGKNAAGDVVEMHHCAAVGSFKGSQDLPWWFLRVHLHARTLAIVLEAKRQSRVPVAPVEHWRDSDQRYFGGAAQLMNNRVSSILCRMDPSSGSGVKQVTSSVSDLAAAS